MADRLSQEQRGRLMSRVKGKETKPEKFVRSLLHHLGFRFRKNVKSLPGTPDIVLPKYKTIIFVHGCFWHQHENCRKAGRPSSNIKFWNEKLDKNIERDRMKNQILSNLGWNVIVIWECELKDVEALERRFKRELLSHL